MTLHPTVEDVMLDPAHFQSAGLIDDQPKMSIRARTDSPCARHTAGR